MEWNYFRYHINGKYCFLEGKNTVYTQDNTMYEIIWIYNDGSALVKIVAYDENGDLQDITKPGKIEKEGMMKIAWNEYKRVNGIQ